MELTLTIDAIDPYRKSLSERGLSSHTIKGYSTDVEMLFKECNLTSLPADHLPATAASWLMMAKMNRMAPKTLRRRTTSIRSFGKYYGQRDILEDFKLPSLSQHIPHPLPGLDDDLQNMFKECRTREQAAVIALLGLMGLRLFEALQTRLEDFDFVQKILTVHGKGGKVRKLPITERAHPYLLHQFIERQVGGFKTLLSYSDRGARKFITELGVKANVARPISSHDLRSTFATLVYANTKDILALQIWLGHESVVTTQLYVAVAMDVLRAAGDI
jgi:site-specific recombinase XerD